MNGEQIRELAVGGGRCTESEWGSHSFAFHPLFIFSLKGEKSDKKTGKMRKRKNGNDWGEGRKQEGEEEISFSKHDGR